MRRMVQSLGGFDFDGQGGITRGSARGDLQKLKVGHAAAGCLPLINMHHGV